MEAKTSNSTIFIKVNGETKIVPQDISILKLLESFKIKEDRVVIEINKEILSKGKFATTKLNANDSLEIVTFVGGG